MDWRGIKSYPKLALGWPWAKKCFFYNEEKCISKSDDWNFEVTAKKIKEEFKRRDYKEEKVKRGGRGEKLRRSEGLKESRYT